MASADRLKVSVIEANVELPFDDTLSAYVTEFVSRVRAKRPYARLRINVAPFKGYRLPVDLFREDDQLYVIAQAYSGNMDGRLPENDVYEDLIAYGIPPFKASVMYGVINGIPVRQYSLPSTVYRAPRRGSIYSDDLLIDSGYLGT